MAPGDRYIFRLAFLPCTKAAFSPYINVTSSWLFFPKASSLVTKHRITDYFFFAMFSFPALHSRLSVYLYMYFILKLRIPGVPGIQSLPARDEARQGSGSAWSSSFNLYNNALLLSFVSKYCEVHQLIRNANSDFRPWIVINWWFIYCYGELESTKLYLRLLEAMDVLSASVLVRHFRLRVIISR